MKTDELITMWAIAGISFFFGALTAAVYFLDKLCI